MIEQLKKMFNKQIEVYSYKGKYYILQPEIKVKNKITRNWETFVTYRAVIEVENGWNLGEVYAREKEEFYKRFKKE